MWKRTLQTIFITITLSSNICKRTQKKFFDLLDTSALYGNFNLKGDDNISAIQSSVYIAFYMISVLSSEFSNQNNFLISVRDKFFIWMFHELLFAAMFIPLQDSTSNISINFLWIIRFVSPKDLDFFFINLFCRLWNLTGICNVACNWIWQTRENGQDY